VLIRSRGFGWLIWFNEEFGSEPHPRSASVLRERAVSALAQFIVLRLTMS
jgi:hypothetical protein